MATLERDLRRRLERCIRDARLRAEQAVRESVARLGVVAGSKPDHLTEGDAALRRALRAHARALGDEVPPGQDGDEPRKLIEAAAYVRWHHLLFVRFLAERGLLRHPEHSDVVLTLRDCAELARDEGLADAYAVAAECAARWLPAVFDADDPACRLELSPEHENALRALVEGLPAPIFAASDSLGWTYQYWRAAEKDAINASGVKIGADELPAVTQLFTEPYMVRFLLDNTLGAWWAGKRFAAEPELAIARDEATLRARLALPGADWAWLRFVREGDDGPWRPAAGIFPGWPREAAQITLLDPCCGSGHFLTEALPILAALRQAEEPKLDVGLAVVAVLRDNLHGLEIDGRCVQIAAFAVALAAWAAGGWQVLPNPHVAWVGSAPKYSRAEFEALGNGDPELRRSLGALHELFRRAPTLGSLIEVSGGDLVARADLHGVENAMARLAEREDADADRHEGAIAARGMADAAALLGRRWVLQATNVPYLGRGKQDANLKSHLERRYGDAKADLATAMLVRMLRGAAVGGSVAAVTPQNWLFLSRYAALRSELLYNQCLDLVVGLGPRAFEAISGEVVNAALVTWTNKRPDAVSAGAGIDANDGRDPASKALTIGAGELRVISQRSQLNNPDLRIATQTLSAGRTLGYYCLSKRGIVSGDSTLWYRLFWEPGCELAARWRYLQSTVKETELFGGKHQLVDWSTEGRGMLRPGFDNESYGKRGVTISLMGSLSGTLSDGELYDNNTGFLAPLDPAHLPAIFAFVESPEFEVAVRQIDRKMNVTNATLVKVSFDLSKWQQTAAERYPDGLPEPYSDDPTQWLFHGHPARAESGTPLHVALARLAGYCWPAETDPNMRLSADARDWIAKAGDLPSTDADGLLPLVACAGERPLAQRLREWCAAAFPEWSADFEARLVREADERLGGTNRRSESNIDDWLRNRAFRQHCKLFHDRPFLWQIWDGRADGFSAFVHYHRFGRGNLEKLAFTLLGDWIGRVENDGDAGAGEAARVLQAELRRILEGEAPLDIFVRWKPRERQPLGWEPDLDDGVRMNIRPFVIADVLRDAVNVHWRKDRGSDVASAPWFNVHGGERINDHHTTLAEKRAAREAAKKRVEAAE